MPNGFWQSVEVFPDFTPVSVNRMTNMGRTK